MKVMAFDPFREAGGQFLRQSQLFEAEHSPPEEPGGLPRPDPRTRVVSADFQVPGIEGTQAHLMPGLSHESPPVPIPIGDSAGDQGLGPERNVPRAAGLRNLFRFMCKSGTFLEYSLER